MNKTFLLKKNIFKKSSTTYYYSSMFFTKDVKQAVFTLYAFVRYADDLVDCIPPKKTEFMNLRKDILSAFKGIKVNNPIIDDFASLAKEKDFDPSWTSSFLDAMGSDLCINEYKTYEDLQKYMHGSAEVIGLFMSKIFNTPEIAFPYAMAQGEAMQFINFLRDIDEDYKLGRRYIPLEDLLKFKVNIPPSPAQEENFCKLMRFEINRYKQIQKEADKGHAYINRRFRIMVKTSAQMYNWTARQIEKDPLIVFRKKVKPPKWYVILTLLKHAIF